MANPSCDTYDYLVVGSGLAGLAFALKVASHGRVCILSKASAEQSNTKMAQGGIAAVTGHFDSFTKHVEDTLTAGAGLCRREVVEDFVRQGPERIADLVRWGVAFDRNTEQGLYDLTREGGHGERRILHVHDHTGDSIHQTLYSLAKQNPNIEFAEDQFVIDVIRQRQIEARNPAYDRCLGVYSLNRITREVIAVKANITVLATGGAGKVYLYTSNWSGATGDGIAIAFRAGVRVANLEFMQFHPTCLYHPHSRNFLISEAVRGEGGELINQVGEAFMKAHHPMGSLAPRDIVARSIDAEMKRTGAECVYLDITHKSRDELKERFPTIYERCLTLGIDPAKEPIPVVPAAHYLCGGILTNSWGGTDLPGLLALGETACTGLHGANRLASNSLLECIAQAHNAALWAESHLKEFSPPHFAPQFVNNHQREDNDELIVISHMWDEIRRLMWNYVGIVRTNRRLMRAQSRLDNILSEVKEYYSNFKLHPDIEELRNIALVADLTVKCALQRKESRGIHYNLDHPETMPAELAKDTIISPY